MNKLCVQIKKIEKQKLFRSFRKNRNQMYLL